jgi:hypothetical protein
MLKGRGVLAGLFLSQLGGLGLSMGGQLLWKGGFGPLLSLAGMLAGTWAFFWILFRRTGSSADRSDLISLAWRAAGGWLMAGGGGYAVCLAQAGDPELVHPAAGGLACGLLLALCALLGTMVTGDAVLLDGSDVRDRYSVWPEQEGG